LGNGAGYENQGNNSIVLNASGSNLNGSTDNAFFVKPIRGHPHGLGIGVLHYDTTTSEITYSTN
jgi:hypothetical protein